MAGDPTKVPLWVEADVLFYNAATLPTADIPATITAPFDTTTGKWGYAGLLSGDDGIDINRMWDETQIPAWGYGIIAVGSKNFKSTARVSAREDNPVIQSVLWPGSTSSTIVTPIPANQFVAIEKRGAFGGIKRLISKRPARLWIPSEKALEGANAPFEINMQFFANAARELFLAQQADTGAVL